MSSYDLREPADAYMTPDDVARAVLGQVDVRPGDRVLEPHGGSGSFVRLLLEQGAVVTATEVNPKLVDAGDPRARWVCGDFLRQRGRYDIVVGNPPFRRWHHHVRHAFSMSARAVHMLLPVSTLRDPEMRALVNDGRAPSRVLFLSPNPRFETLGGKKHRVPTVLVSWTARHKGPTSTGVLPCSPKRGSVQTGAWDSEHATPWGVAIELDRMLGFPAGAEVLVPSGESLAAWVVTALRVSGVRVSPVTREGLLAGELGASGADGVLAAPPTRAFAEWARRALQATRHGGRVGLLASLDVMSSPTNREFWHEHPARITVLPWGVGRGDRGRAWFGLFEWTVGVRGEPAIHFPEALVESRWAQPRPSKRTPPSAQTVCADEPLTLTALGA
jgi:hypothetical protein